MEDFPAKLAGLILFGAAGIIPIRVVAAMIMAPFKASDRTILAASAAASFVIVGATIFG